MGGGLATVSLAINASLTPVAADVPAESGHCGLNSPSSSDGNVMLRRLKLLTCNTDHSIVVTNAEPLARAPIL